MTIEEYIRTVLSLVFNPAGVSPDFIEGGPALPVESLRGGDEDLSGVVSIDEVQRAAMLILARVAARSLPALLRKRIVKLKYSLIGAAMKQAGSQALFSTAARRTVLRLIDDVFAVVDEREFQVEFETEIRRQSLKVRRDLLKRGLKKNKQPNRRSEWVMTRTK